MQKGDVYASSDGPQPEDRRGACAGCRRGANPPAKPEKAKSGTTARFQVKPFGGPYSMGAWTAVLTGTISPTAGNMGSDGATGTHGADAGSLTIEAGSYDTSAFTDDKVFFIADCTGGKGQQGGSGGDGGDGGKGVDQVGSVVETLSSAMDNRFTFRRSWHMYNGNKESDPEYQDLIVNGFLGAKGGTPGRQGAGGYGGSGGQFIVNLPKGSADDDKLKARFGVQSNVGIPGAVGPAGNPGRGGRCGDSWLLKFPTNIASKDKLDGELGLKLQFDWSSDVVNKWAAYLVNGTEPPQNNGDAATALNASEIESRRAGAGQHEPTTSPNMVFNESK